MNYCSSYKLQNKSIYERYAVFIPNCKFDLAIQNGGRKCNPVAICRSAALGEGEMRSKAQVHECCGKSILHRPPLARPDILNLDCERLCARVDLLCPLSLKLITYYYYNNVVDALKCI